LQDFFANEFICTGTFHSKFVILVGLGLNFKIQEWLWIVKYVTALIYGVWPHKRTHPGLPCQKPNPNRMIYVKNDVLTAKSSKLKWNNFKFGSKNQ